MSPSATQKNGVVSPSPSPSQSNGAKQAPQVQIDGVQVDGNNGKQGGSSRKLTTLRDATQRAVAIYRAELGSSAQQFFSSCESVEVFFDSIAGIRLRQMPHHSGRWDKILKWAEFFAAQVYGYFEEVSQFAEYAEEAAHIIWASCLSLIEVFCFPPVCMPPLTIWKAWSKIHFSLGKNIRGVLQLWPHSRILPSSS
jgi:hypothetical protein